MAIRIPRYDSNLGSSPVSSGRSLTTGVTDTMSNMGNSAMKLVSTYADSQIRMEAKLRDLDLVSKNENGKNDSLLHNDDFVYQIETSGRSDWEAWEGEFIDSYDKLTATKTSVGGAFDNDDVAWKKHEPFHTLGRIEGIRNIRNLAKKQRLVNAQREYDKTWINTQNKIDTASSAEEVQSIYQTWTDDTLTSYAKTEFIDGQRYKSDGEGMLAYANNSFLFHQSNKGVAPLQAPNGTSAINWGELANKAADPNFKMTDVQGNELTVDDPLRRGLVKSYREKDSEQDTFFERERTDKERGSKISFADRIITMSTGQPDGNFLTDLEKDKTLSPEAKLTLKNAYFTTVTNIKDKTKPWETQQGIAAEGMLRYLISANVIDTVEEKAIIRDFWLNGQLISPDTMTALDKLVDEKIKTKNAPYAMLYKRAVGTIMKEMGEKPDKLAALSNMSANGGSLNSIEQLQNFMDGLSGQMSQEAFMAIQNLDRVIAEGQKKGYSVENMLANVESSNYVVNDIIKVYKDLKVNSAQTTFNATAQQYINKNWMTDGKYGIDAAGWANSTLRSNPTVVNVPVRNENESMSQYLPRLDAWMLKNKFSNSSNLPLFLQGNATDAGGANFNVVGE